MKKMVIGFMSVVVTLAVSAAPRATVGVAGGAAVKAAQDALDAKVKISQMPNLGQQSLIPAPALAAGGQQPITKKPRRWGVYDLTFRTVAKWTEDLTVNWYVLSDTTKAKVVDKSRTAAELPPFVYYTVSTRYVNIPEGDHRSGVCLPPSFVERYGEPVVISCEIMTSAGKLLHGGTVVNGLQAIAPGLFTEEDADKNRWWNNDKIINAKKKNGDPMVELRQGLVDRSKSPFALVNSADYEQVQ